MTRTLSADDVGHVAALASLPGMGPARLTGILAALGAGEAWAAVAAGRLLDDVQVVTVLGPAGPTLAAHWRRLAGRTSPADLVAAHDAAGVRLALLGWPGFPGRLVDDPEPPVLLCERGLVGVVDGVLPAVGIVGTRSCTPDGRATAWELGRDLAAAGVAVVSGLALGIDTAAHEGALSAGDGAAPPIGVVATGLDVVYPPRNRRLWADVGSRGLLLSEAPLGTRAERWRFPARNRIIAGLSDAVVVVESHAQGGSLHTVDAAVERGVTVLAVPGPVRSPASAGSNGLLAERAMPCCSVQDVLVALALAGRPVAAPPARPVDQQAPSAHRRPAPAGADALVLDAVGTVATPTEHVLVRTGLAPGPAVACLLRLEAAGWVVGGGGWWTRATAGATGRS